VRIWVIACIQKPSHHFLQTFRPLRIFKIVFRDSSLYPKQYSLFCLLRLSSASDDRIGYITSFCSMIELLIQSLQDRSKIRSLQIGLCVKQSSRTLSMFNCSYLTRDQPSLILQL